MRILIMLAAASVALWGMSNYASYINSTMLAVLVVLACGPLIDRLRPRVSRWVVLLVCLTVSLFGLGLLLLFMTYAGAQFALALPTYKQQAQALVQQLQTWLQSMGLDEAGAGAIASQVDPSSSLDWAKSLLSSLAGALSNGITLALILVFLFVDVVLFPGRLAWQGLHRSSYAKRVADYAIDLRQYIVVMVIVGTAVGAANTVFFFVMGVPMPLLWGVLSGLLNFIPFIGFWFGLIPPAVLTLLEYGWGRMLLVAAGYILINATVQNVIQPKLVVSRLNLTPLMSLLSSTFWPLVLGPVGAIIGVPLTMSVRSLVLDADPSTRWLADMMCTTIPQAAAAAPEENTTLESAIAQDAVSAVDSV
jgi:predicted PurR-regulated permease PerM